MYGDVQDFAAKELIGSQYALEEMMMKKGGLSLVYEQCPDSSGPRIIV